MPKIKVNFKKYHLFIYKPSYSYVILERNQDSVFGKLLIIHDSKFEKVSENQTVTVQFLEYDRKSNWYRALNDNSKTVKVNQLMDLPTKMKISIKLKTLLGIN